MTELIERLDAIARMFEGHPDEVHPPNYSTECEAKDLLFALVDELRTRNAEETLTRQAITSYEVRGFYSGSAQTWAFANALAKYPNQSTLNNPTKRTK